MLFFSFYKLLPGLSVAVLDVYSICYMDRVTWRSPFSCTSHTNSSPVSWIDFPYGKTLPQNVYFMCTSFFPSSPPIKSAFLKEKGNNWECFLKPIMPQSSTDAAPLTAVLIHFTCIFVLQFRMVSMIIWAFYGAEDCSCLWRKLVIKQKLS